MKPVRTPHEPTFFNWIFEYDTSSKMGLSCKVGRFIEFNFNDFDLLTHQILQFVIEVYIWISAHAQLVMIVSHKWYGLHMSEYVKKAYTYLVMNHRHSVTYHFHDRAGYESNSLFGLFLKFWEVLHVRNHILFNPRTLHILNKEPIKYIELATPETPSCDQKHTFVTFPPNDIFWKCCRIWNLQSFRSLTKENSRLSS